jgi:Tfp pilus assembly protein PilF
MMVTSYYNRGVRELQRGDAAAAAKEFGEGLEVDPEDEDLRRHHLFARTYQSRPKDLLYRIYVKYLPTR